MYCFYVAEIKKRKTMKKLWTWINGKKTLIGIGLHLAWFAVNMVKKDLTDSGQFWEGHGYIGVITGVGVGHKITKNKDKISESINRVNPTKNNKNE